MNTINNSTILRLRKAAHAAHGLFIAVENVDADSDVVRLVAVSTYNNRADFVKNHEAATQEAWASFYASCDAAQQRWLSGEFRFEAGATHRDRRYVSGEFLNVRG